MEEAIHPPALAENLEVDEGQMTLVRESGAEELLQVPCGGCGEHLVYVGYAEIQDVLYSAYEASRSAGGAWVMLACKRCRQELAKGTPR